MEGKENNKKYNSDPYGIIYKLKQCLFCLTFIENFSHSVVFLLYNPQYSENRTPITYCQLPLQLQLFYN